MILMRKFRETALSAAALLGLSAGVSRAADATPAPAAAPAVEAGPACATCAAEGCQTCSGKEGCHKNLLGGMHLHTKKVHVPYLCPGACFGYFQTKWNRWEDVCGHYYQGINVSDAPKAPIPAAKQPPTFGKPSGTGTGTSPMLTPMPIPEGKAPIPSAPLPSPSVVPPTPKTDLPIGPKASDLPPLPVVPPSKFSP